MTYRFFAQWIQIGASYKLRAERESHITTSRPKVDTILHSNAVTVSLSLSLSPLSVSLSIHIYSFSLSLSLSVSLSSSVGYAASEMLRGRTPSPHSLSLSLSLSLFMYIHNYSPTFRQRMKPFAVHNCSRFRGFLPAERPNCMKEPRMPCCAKALIMLVKWVSKQ